jgi:hypothetical protein
MATCPNDGTTLVKIREYNHPDKDTVLVVRQCPTCGFEETTEEK